MLHVCLLSPLLLVLFLQDVDAVLSRLSDIQLLVVAAVRSVLTWEWKCEPSVDCNRRDILELSDAGHLATERPSSDAKARET